MTSITNNSSFSVSTVYEKLGQFLQISALSWIRPIDYVVENSMHTFMAAILPGNFGNAPSYGGEITRRVMGVFFSVFSLPVTLALYGIGEILDLMGDVLHSKPYHYLKGELEEKTDLAEKKSLSFFSANLCMLPYGIFILGGVRPPSLRIEQAAEAILQADQDFVCLQEMSHAPSLALWDKIKGSYAHGFTRIGPMPANRMGGALFFASKYKIEEVRYHPLPNIGPIVRGVFCAKTEKGWIINGHLSAGSSPETVHLRSLQVEEIVKLCRELSQEGKIPCFICMDSNIKRIGKEGDEYSNSGLSNYFINGVEEDKSFVLTPDSATCTNCLTSSIRGEEDPEDVEEGFEHIDCIMSYKPSNADIKMMTKVMTGYNLDKREEALSDHHILVCEASWK